MIRIANLLDRELGFRPKMDIFYRFPTVAALASSYKQHSLQNQTLLQLEPGTEQTLASFKPLLEPEEREAFKNRERGIRREDHEKASVKLAITEPDDAIKRRYAERRSYRQFTSKLITINQLSRILRCLRQIELNGKPKYLYASPGGLYPVQTYLYMKAGPIEALGAGIYYYHPVDHRLVLLTPDVQLDRHIYHPFINAPIFDEAAFAVFLVAQLKAIAPMYGEQSTHFATLEAGELTQLMESAAPSAGIGLCQVGTLDFQRIRHLFVLDEGHVLVHLLLGGPIDKNGETAWLPFQEAFHAAPVKNGDREEGSF
jgi:pyochelin synthetase